MRDHDLSDSLLQLIQNDFFMESRLDEESKSDYDRIFKWLKMEIEILLDQDFERLLNILYRIDIGEEDLKRALSLESSADLASLLTDLVIKRELQKVESRKRYKVNPNYSD